MLGINLLPPEEKQILRLAEARRAVTLFTRSCLLIMAVGAALLLPSYFYSHFFTKELKQSLAAAERDGSDRALTHAILTEAKKTRDAVSEARTYLAAPASGAQIMEYLSVPGDGIALASFFIRSTGDIAIEGHAGTRDQLLAFEQRLRASDLFLEVAFPLGDLVRERDIRFSARAKLKMPFGL